MTDAFERLGREIDRAWRATSYSPDAFSPIAVASLQRARLASRLSPSEVLDAVLGDAPLPLQFDVAGEFGEPPVTLFHSARFTIDVLFWMDGTTSIHDHAFSGAFQVLSGSSVHGCYDFARRRHVSSGFELGRLRFRSMELLEAGDLRPIIAGRGFIHSLFHLDRPSTTIVVRTRHEPEHTPQLSYLAPHVGYSQFAEDERTRRRFQAMAAARAFDEDLYWHLLRRHAADLDLHALFLVLYKTYRRGDGGKLRAALARARARERRAIDEIVATIELWASRAWIIQLRTSVHDPELRFFLAVLMNAPDRKHVLALVRARYPRRDPWKCVLGWLRALAALPGPDGNGIVGFDDDDQTLRIIELVLKDATPSSLSRGLARDYDGVGEQHAELRAFRTAIRAHPMLASWWPS